MSDRTVALIRWVLLASAVFNLLQATVLHDVLQRHVLRPWQAMAERAGGRVPAPLRDERLPRAWPGLMAGVFGALWWYLGTPAGTETLRRMFR